jgi:hypothetical protein
MDVTLYYGPRRYNYKIMGQYENIFGCKPQKFTSPVENGNHPEVYCSDELDNDGIKRYQTIIGCCQWAVSHGRFDIQTATMTMSNFGSAPRQGQFDRLKRIYEYLKKFSSAAIQVQTLVPDIGNSRSGL